MLVMFMPVIFRIGATADVKIDAEPKRLTWRDAKTLVIEPDDARQIICRTTDGESLQLICSDVDGSGGDQVQLELHLPMQLGQGWHTATLDEHGGR